MANQNQELAEIEIKNPLEVFTTEKGLDAYLKPLEDLVYSFHGDASTDKGRKEIKSFCYKLARSKTHLDSIGKELVAELKRKPKLVDAERKRVRDLIDQWCFDCRKPLTDYENREQERIKEIESRIAIITNAINKMQVITDLDELNNITSNYENYADFDAQEFEEKKRNELVIFSSMAQQRKEAIALIQEQEKQRKLEEQKAIDARIFAQKAEAEEREKKLKEQLEQQKKEAEANKVKFEAELKAREEQKAIDAQKALEMNEKIKKEREEAQKLREAELERSHKEEDDRQKKMQDEAASRDKAHRHAVILEVLESVKTVLDEESAKKITRAIVKGEIARLAIDYSVK